MAILAIGYTKVVFLVLYIFCVDLLYINAGWHQEVKKKNNWQCWLSSGSQAVSVTVSVANITVKMKWCSDIDVMLSWFLNCFSTKARRVQYFSPKSTNFSCKSRETPSCAHPQWDSTCSGSMSPCRQTASPFSIFDNSHYHCWLMVPSCAVVFD